MAQKTAEGNTAQAPVEVLGLLWGLGLRLLHELLLQCTLVLLVRRVRLLLPRLPAARRFKGQMSFGRWRQMGTAAKGLGNGKGGAVGTLHLAPSKPYIWCGPNHRLGL